MKKIMLVLTTTVCLLLGVSSFAETKETRIGVVDYNKAISESPQLEKAKKEFKEKFAPNEKKLLEEQKSFQTAIEAYNKNSPTMEQKKQKEEQAKIMEQQKKLQELSAKFQKEAEAAQNKMLGDIVKKVDAIVSQIAVDKKYDVILNKLSAAYYKKDLEITDEVMSQLKKEKK